MGTITHERSAHAEMEIARAVARNLHLAGSLEQYTSRAKLALDAAHDALTHANLAGLPEVAREAYNLTVQLDAALAKAGGAS